MMIFATSLSPADQRAQSLRKLIRSYRTAISTNMRGTFAELCYRQGVVAYVRQNGFSASRQASTRLTPMSLSM